MGAGPGGTGRGRELGRVPGRRWLTTGRFGDRRLSSILLVIDHDVSRAQARLDPKRSRFSSQCLGTSRDGCVPGGHWAVLWGDTAAGRARGASRARGAPGATRHYQLRVGVAGTEIRRGRSSWWNLSRRGGRARPSRATGEQCGDSGADQDPPKAAGASWRPAHLCLRLPSRRCPCRAVVIPSGQGAVHGILRSFQLRLGCRHRQLEGALFPKLSRGGSWTPFGRRSFEQVLAVGSNLFLSGGRSRRRGHFAKNRSARPMLSILCQHRW